VHDGFDAAYVAETLVALARTPTDVPLGQNEIEPTDPKVGHYIRDVVRPMIESLNVGPVTIDELNNLTCIVGSGARSPSLLVMAYATAQHGNYTDPALEGRLMNGRAYGCDEDCVFGKGTAQNKGALAALLGALKIIASQKTRLRGSLTIVVNTESQSSHRCSVALFDGAGLRADAGWLAMGTPGIIIGHRGRVDVHLTVKGEAGHSSQPHLGKNAIFGLREALNRLADLRARIAQHDADPDLGREHLEPYKLVTSPIAPHTMPDTASLTIDRRVLPGADPAQAVEEIRIAVGEIRPYAVEVRAGAAHLPYRVPRDHPIVATLTNAHASVRGAPPWIGYVPYAFDAGYANFRGVPTVMFGPPTRSRRESGPDVLASEFVPLSEVWDFTKIYAQAILSTLG
jgi:acetylornithine deacetylase/succinyl-diaminopimelate desuccinylase-like protein